MTDRTRRLNQIEQLLSAPEGVALMEELEATWDQHVLLGQSPEETAYNVGLRDAFKFLKMLQMGDVYDG